jgi:hypothetical protein
VCAVNFLALVRVRFDGFYFGPLPYGVLQAKESRRRDDWIFARHQARNRERRYDESGFTGIRTANPRHA